MKKPIKSSNNNTLLSAGYSYTLGKFRLILDEKTEELKVIVETNKENLLVKPSSSNAVILIAR
jgi:hypothetical protein